MLVRISYKNNDTHYIRHSAYKFVNIVALAISLQIILQVSNLSGRSFAFMLIFAIIALLRFSKLQ